MKTIPKTISDVPAFQVDICKRKKEKGILGNTLYHCVLIGSLNIHDILIWLLPCESLWNYQSSHWEKMFISKQQIKNDKKIATIFLKSIIK